MAMKISLDSDSEYVKSFSLSLNGNVCIITGANGSGKSVLLQLIKSGAVKVEIDGNEINPRRILNFNPTNIQNYSIQDYGSPNVGNQPYVDGQQLIEHISHLESKEKIDDVLYKSFGIKSKDDSRISIAVAEKDWQGLIQIAQSVAFSTFDHKIASALKGYYQNKARISIGEAVKGVTSSQVKKFDTLDIEEMLNKTLELMHLPYKMADKSGYVQKVIDEQLASIQVIDAEVQNLRRMGQTELNPFNLTLQNVNTMHIINFDQISAGERSLFGLAAIPLAHELDKGQQVPPEVILFDEADAHLHPLNIKYLMDIISEIFVRRVNLAVIMVTHSPISIAASDENIIVVMKDGKLEGVDKNVAMRNLMTGLPYISVNSNQNRYTVTESQKDADIYTKIFEIARKSYSYTYNPIFIPSSSIDDGGNKDRVVHIVNSIPNGDLGGIVDWDLSNKGDERVRVMGEGERYSIENSIFDPLVVMTFLIHQSLAKNEDFTLPKGLNTTEILMLNREELQKACKTFSDTILGVENDFFREITYSGGIKLYISMKYLDHQGHKLQDKIYERYHGLKGFKSRTKDMIISHLNNFPELMPNAFIKLFDSLYN